MRVKLLNHTPIEVAYFSARTCYSSDSAIDMELKSKEEMVDFIKKILDTGHHSTVEGINFTFAIEGVSRSLMAQLTRHRTGIQFSVQSQRYVKFTEDSFDYVTPKSIQGDKSLRAIYESTIKTAKEAYITLVNFGVKAEDARYLLPNATCTNITTTINLRELIHIMGLRRCSAAQWEIRDLMKLMAEEVVVAEPWLKPYMVAQCEQLGYCPESEKRCCGRKPTLKKQS